MRTPRSRPRLAAAISLAVAASLLAPAPQAQAPPGPRLLVIVVVDQMRADYLTRFDRYFTRGFRRLIDHGAIFEQTFYPYLNTVTCAGHATIGTGAWPKTHGIILNEWFRRDLGRVRSCTADAATTPVQYYGTAEKEGHSARELLTPTLAERLRARWPDSRSVSLAVKPRSAIMMAGKGATAVTWVGTNGWQTSSAYTDHPVPQVAQALGPDPFKDARGIVWERSRPDGDYTGSDAGLGERPPKGWTSLFPHPLTSPTAPEEFVELWQTSPYSDQAVATLASRLVQGFQLGQRGVVDFLGVSFPAVDKVGHDFGGDSFELQDTVLRLDATLGSLLDALDAAVGRDGYALALSADHGSAPVPEARQAAGLPAGRVALATAAAAVEQALVGAGLGAGPHVARIEYTELYLTEATRAKLTAETAAPAVAALRAIPGVQTAVWTPQLATLDESDPVVRAIKASFVANRSGDFTLAPAPYWIFVPGRNPNGGNATTHGSANPYDQHVPLVFYGGPFTHGRIADAATPADAAPTLGATVGLAFDGVEGRPQPAALKR